MRVGYRLCKRKYAPANSDGARKAGGRWNSKGQPALYLADSVALAVLEVTVHALELPTDYLLWRFHIPDDAITPVGELAPGWRDPKNVEVMRQIGTDWLREKRSAGLSVPSVIVPLERNYVLNPEHPAFFRIKWEGLGDFEFDQRLRPTHASLTHDG